MSSRQVALSLGAENEDRRAGAARSATVGTREFAYRFIFERSGSRIAIDSINVSRGRIEVEIDQMVQEPSAADLAVMKAADRSLADEMDAKLGALG